MIEKNLIGTFFFSPAFNIAGAKLISRNTQSLMNRLKRIIDCNSSSNLTLSIFFNKHFDKVIFLSNADMVH